MPDIKGSFSGGSFRVQGKGGSVSGGGPKMETDSKQNQGKGPCYNNLQCQEWAEKAIDPATNNPYGSFDGADANFFCNNGVCECTGADCPPAQTPIPTSTPNPTATPRPTATPQGGKSGAWCTGAIACDGKFYISGCASGSISAWVSGDNANQVQNFQENATCASLNCSPETTPECTPTPTPTPQPTSTPVPTPPPTYGL